MEHFSFDTIISVGCLANRRSEGGYDNRMSSSACYPLYHITHIDNLSGIIEAEGLWCDKIRIEQKIVCKNIAHLELKERRMRTPVPVFPDTTLGDFVPFYFANRSPMLYSIHTGYVEGYSGGQVDVIYLVTSTDRLAGTGRRWCFTDGHAVEAFSSFYADLTDLHVIDWSVIENWSWRNTQDDNDRKRRKQAEFLVEESVPLAVFSHIAVKNSIMQTKVEKILAKYDIAMPVTIEPNWYY